MAYDREVDIRKVMASNPGMTYDEAAAQVDKNAGLNASLTSDFKNGGLNLGSLNKGLQSFIKKSGVKSLKTSGDNAKIDREATEGSILGITVNETKGGFQSLTATTKEGETVTIEPSIALMTADVPGITITKTSGKKTEITTLTGRTTSDGFLNATVTQGSPKGIENVLKLTVGADDNKIRAAITETSSNGTVAVQNIGVDIKTKATSDVKKINEKTNTLAANPFGALNNLLSGAAGNPFGNILSNLAGVIKGTLRRGDTKTETFGTVISAGGISVTDAINDASVNLQRLVDATNQLGVTIPQPGPIGKQANALTDTASTDVVKSQGYESKQQPANFTDETGNTNLNRTITPEVTWKKPTQESYVASSGDLIFKLNGTARYWDGDFTSFEDGKFKFELIRTKEELETELSNAVAKRPISLLTVGSTGSAVNQNFDAKFMHFKHINVFAKYWLNRAQKRNFGGLQYHYIILKDGSIQRGRPVSIRQFAGVNKFAKYNISIAFDAGYTFDHPPPKGIDKKLFRSAETINAEQWKAFDLFVSAYIKAVPGGQVLSNQEIRDTNSPGFNASEWIESKYGIESVYIDDNQAKVRYNANKDEFSPAELARLLAKNPIKPTITPISTKPAPAPVAAKVADPKTGQPPAKTIDEKNASEVEYNRITREIDSKTKKYDRFETEYKTLNKSSERATFVSGQMTTLASEIEALRTQALEIESENKGFARIDELEIILTKTDAKKSGSESKYTNLITIRGNSTDVQIAIDYGSVSEFEAELTKAKNAFEEALTAFNTANRNYTQAVRESDRQESR